MTIILYDLVGSSEDIRFSPHCWKTRMSLAHKGLEYQTVPTTFVGVPEVEDGVSKTIPVIRDGERVIADSFAIALYLDEGYPDRPALFEGEGGRSMGRFIERWSQLTSAWRPSWRKSTFWNRKALPISGKAAKPNSGEHWKRLPEIAA